MVAKIKLPARNLLSSWFGWAGFVAEYRFHPKRRWRFDWAEPSLKIAIEIQGGLFTRGRHTRGAALMREYEKLNAAQLDGWIVLLVTPKQVKSGEVNLLVDEAMKARQV